MFVTTTTAQALAFVSKIATAMIIPQIAAYISFYSARKALQLSFFSSISNFLSVLMDTRTWKHRKNIPAFATKVTILSWFTIVLSLLLYGTIVASDVLVFQLARRRNDWKFYPNNDLNLTFEATTAKISDQFNASAPWALVDQEHSKATFGNNTYIPAESYNYVQMVPNRTIIEGSTEFFDSVKRVVFTDRRLVSSDYTCFCSHQVDARQVAEGIPLIAVVCESDSVPASVPYSPSIGFNKRTNVLAYQGNDGAHFSFMTSKQRNRYIINETTDFPRTTRNYLDDFMEDYNLIGQQQGGVPVDDISLYGAMMYLSSWRNSNSNREVILTYYKIDDDMKYGKIPVYTYSYVIVEIIGMGRILEKSNDDFAAPGLIMFNYITYTSQDIFVPNKRIQSKYLGIDKERISGARSTSILTDESPEHVIITMLDDPQQPILVQSVEMVDAWPAVLLIIISGIIALIFFGLRFVHKINSNSRHSFDPRLEIFHSALFNWKGNPADSLLTKMQETDLVMANGYSPDIDGNKIGLVSKDADIETFAKNKVYK